MKISIHRAASLISQAISVYKDMGVNRRQAFPFTNKSILFGHTSTKRDERVESLDSPISMKAHILEVTGKEISGSTLYQTLYIWVKDHFDGKDVEREKKVKASTIEALEEYIRIGAKVKEEEVANSPGGLEEAGAPASSGVDLPQHLQDYIGTTWYVYSYEEYLAKELRPGSVERLSFVWGLGRSVLRINHPNDITITNFQSDGSLDINNSNYRGTLSLNLENFTDIIGINLYSDPERDKYLHVRMLRSVGPQSGLKLGAYMNRGTKNELVSGSLVFELLRDASVSPEPRFLRGMSEEYRQVDRTICRFLAKKQLNHLSIPSNISGSKSLYEWVERERRENMIFPDRYMNFEYDAFIAAPFTDLADTERQELEATIDEIKSTMAESLGLRNIYSALGGPDDHRSFWDDRLVISSEVLNRIRRSRYFILIYPQKVVSTSLIETGWALGSKKPVIVFYKDINDLPSVLKKPRYVRHLVSVHLAQFQEYSDIVETIRQDRFLFDWN